MNEKYQKIIDLPHHVSKTRVTMPKSDRAAQFAPYAALNGYEDAVDETARLTDSRIELDEYEKERINTTLMSLLSSPEGTRASITYFRPDEYKSGGAYVTTTGEIAHVDEIERALVLIGGYKISVSDIFEIQVLEKDDF